MESEAITQHYGNVDALTEPLELSLVERLKIELWLAVH